MIEHTLFKCKLEPLCNWLYINLQVGTCRFI